MHHFRHLDAATRTHLFAHEPAIIDPDGDLAVLAMSLGATLYIPAMREDLTGTVRRRAAEGVVSMVIDLEDAVADHDLDVARGRVIAALDALVADPPPVTLFVRVRTDDDIEFICRTVTSGLAVLDGFVLPKFRSANGSSLLTHVRDLSAEYGRRLLVMPVLESREVLYRESRDAELLAIGRILAGHRDRVLAVRIGATDLCSAFGIRRDRDLTIYDVRVVADTIGSIVNHLARADGTGFIVTGPVWEYFAAHERMFRPMLRQTPFEDPEAVTFRQQLVSRDLDGLLREVALDRANGLHGKTVIHPSHVPAVHALQVVSAEEYTDAFAISGSATSSGVMASGYGNKMNEVGPHRAWAQLTMARAEVFGVTREGVSFVDVMQALARR